MIRFTRFHLLLILLVMISLRALPANVNRQTAYTVASNFMTELLHRQNRTPGNQNLQFVYTGTSVSGEIYHLFAGQQGFVIIAADDCVQPVLAYSPDATLSQENPSPEFLAWMETYARQIDYIREHQLPAPPEIESLWSRFTSASFVPDLSKGACKAVEPLVDCTWDQGKYYNFLCPEDPAGPDGHVWAGCVATAMAMVMYYYRYPQHGSGTHSYASDYGWLTANFGNTDYVWEGMQNDINARYNFQMAQLQYHAGIGVDMMYSPDGSGAYMDDAVETMISHFGYSSTAMMKNRDNYSYSGWQALLKNEIDNGRPMLYSGHGTGGHAFICDGYQDADYFHFNWGWSGHYNGYFYLNNLNPGYTFNSWQQASVNLFPAASYPAPCSGFKTLTFTRGTLEDGSSPLADYQNNSDCRWLIEPAEPVDYITINFNKLHTEAGQDVVTIYDGSSTSDPVLAMVSGDSVPPAIVSSGPRVLVCFTSNGNNTGQGWFLTYDGKNTIFCNNLTTLTAPSGVISDGSNQYDYNVNTFCRWRIHPPQVSSVTLSFNTFDLAPDGDFIKVYDENSNAEIGNYTSGSLPQSLTVYSDKILLFFRSNSSVNATGWELSYSSEPLGAEEADGGFFSMGPNPAADFLFISGSVETRGDAVISIYNATGMLVAEFNKVHINPQGMRLSLPNLPSGMYFIQTTTPAFSDLRKISVF